MRTLFLVLTVVAVAFIAINRQRLYLRDPLATVYRNEIKQTDTRVFINYANDVLVQRGNGPQIEEYLIQGWNGVPGLPTKLRCLQALACLAAADHGTTVPLVGATRAQMTSRRVTFIDEAHVAIRIVLR